MHRTLIAAPLLLSLAFGAYAQDTSAGDDDVLRGPAVTQPDEEAAPSIVDRGFDGAVQRIEGPPEMAAIAALELDDEARRRVDDALAERNAAIDGILADHLGLYLRAIQIFQSGAVGATGDREGRREVVRTLLEVREVAKPILDRGTLRDELAGALEGDDKDGFVRMLAEYDEAIAEAASGAMRAEPGERRRSGQRRGSEDRRAAFRSVLLEFGASYERVIGQRVEDYRAVLDSLDVDATTKGVIEAAVQGSLSEMTDDPEGYDRAALVREILEELTPEQRRGLLSEMRRVIAERGGG